ncbi:MAG: flavin reductase family protein [Lachnospiraceae bacterium]|nr:flavin reductase family protein [Lachnospiraceae bacterium]
MAKREFKPGNMLYPLPAVLITAASESGEKNIFTVSWAGTVCTNPPMISISVRPGRHSYRMIEETGEFVVNLTTEKLAFAADYCGVVSGRDVDKFARLGLTPLKGQQVSAPLIAESPVNIECRVKQKLALGSHDLFLAQVVAVTVDDSYIDENDSFDLSKANPIVYSHGGYFTLGKQLGTFGYSVSKKSGKTMRKNKQKKY